MNFRWLADLLAHHPYVVLIGVTLVSGTCLILPFTIYALPKFSDPQEGFETRGTVLANRITAWKNLQTSITPSGPLIANPKEITGLENLTSTAQPQMTKKPKKVQIYGKQRNYTTEETTNKTNSEVEHDKWAALQNLLNSKQFNERISKSSKKKNYFCGPPADVYVRIVVEANDGEDLFTFESLLSICQLESELIETVYYKDLCVQPVKNPNHCCKPWSLPNYIAQLNNKSNCMEITEQDIAHTKSLLSTCVQYFHNFQLGSDCFENTLCKVPFKCMQYNSVYNILNFLTSTSFLPPNRTTSDLVLKQTMIFLPLATSIAVLPYYRALEKKIIEYKSISVVGAEFGIKNELFNQYLKHDAWLMSMGIVFVLICIWMYTKSMFLTLMTIIAIAFSLGISYFMYTLVFELRFFPFMNLLVIVVAIGIGADDAFIFCKVWKSMKKQTTSIAELLSTSFQRVFVSVLITSATTAAAFSASYISSITTIRCFSVFATTAVVVNLILMMSWLPACIVIIETWNERCSTRDNLTCSFSKPRCKVMEQLVENDKCSVIMRWWRNKEKVVVDGVLKFHHYWLALLSLVTLCSVVVVFYYPKLQLPTSEDFQLFESSHLFEKYDLIYKHMFWFSKSERDVYENFANNKLPLRFVWGVLPKDNGNYLDPASLGELELDPNFDISKSDSQEWLLSFCRKIRKQPFYHSTSGPLLPNCFIEYFVTWMQRRCVNSITNVDHTPCCETTHFPFTRAVFNDCIVTAMSDLFETPTKYFVPGVAGPKFSKDQFPTIKALVVEYDSNFAYSTSYQRMKEFFDSVEEWTIEELKSAPPGMRRGWFLSDFQFYDLQSILCENTFTAIGLSMCLAFVVLMLATLNIVTSVYAVITILSTILVIVAVLVLLGWQLNVLESIAISTAIGLAVDFSLHYIIHYGLCPDSEDRKTATIFALTNMAGPTSMAAATTGAVGAFMMPSCIIPYIRIGVFLVTVMCVSWFYATFFLGSLLAIAGPQNHFGQLRFSALCSCCVKQDSPVRDPENRLESSITDNFELDSLTCKNVARFPNGRFTCDQCGTIHQPNDVSSPTTSAITVVLMDEN